MYERAFALGATFDDFLSTAEANRDLWGAFARRARVPEDVLPRLQALEGCWRLLILADDWCGDAVNTVPVIARLADGSDHVEARIVPRDLFPEIRDRHLTSGKQAIPVVIVMDERGDARGHWGPRPDELQSMVMSELRDQSSADRYREVRRWYARDRGATTAREIAELIERASASAAAANLPATSPAAAVSGATRPPCPKRRAA